ncbi:hypothetical protein [Thermococcus sp.]
MNWRTIVVAPLVLLVMSPPPKGHAQAPATAIPLRGTFEEDPAVLPLGMGR